jgi:hypothetical protein
MTSVCCDKNEKNIVNEFIELFKLPWEFFSGRNKYTIFLTSQENHETGTRPVIMYQLRFITRFERIM